MDVSLQDWEENFNKLILNQINLKSGELLNLKKLIDKYPKKDEFNFFLENEVEFAINKLKNKKSSGPDKITNKNIKCTLQVSMPGNHQIF